MNRIKNETLVPQGGGFVYVDPDTLLRDPEKATFKHCRVDILMGIAKNHRKINNYPIGVRWNEEFIENVCANTLGDVCTDETPLTTVQKAKNLASAIYESAKTGFKTVTPEQMVERQTICQTSGPNGKACPHYVGATGLLSVYCGKCGCSKLKLHLQSSVCPINKWPILSQ